MMNWLHRLTSPPGVTRTIGEEVAALQPMTEGPPPSAGDKQAGAATIKEHPDVLTTPEPHDAS